MPSPHDTITALGDLAHQVGAQQSVANGMLATLQQQFAQFTQVFEGALAAVNTLTDAQDDLLGGVHDALATTTGTPPQPPAPSPADIGWPPAEQQTTPSSSSVGGGEVERFATMDIAEFKTVMNDKRRELHDHLTLETLQALIKPYGGRLDQVDPTLRYELYTKLCKIGGDAQ